MTDDKPIAEVVPTEEDDRMARAICQERCAFMGEPACWQLDADDGGPYPWPNEHCDEPGCMALARAASATRSPAP